MFRCSVLLAALFSCAVVVAQHGDEYVSTVIIVNADGSAERTLFPYPADASGLAVSPDGTRIAYAGRGPDIWLANMDGSDSTNFTNTTDTNEFHPAWSPNGTKIAYTGNQGSDPSGDILIKDIATGVVTNLTNSFSNEDGPSWSPDGKQIAFSSNRDGNTQIYIAGIEGKQWTNVTNDFVSGVHYVRPSWSPDGAVISFTTRSTSGTNIGLVHLADGTREEFAVEHLPESVRPAWSPDGTRLAFFGREHEDNDILVMDIANRSITNLTNGPGSNTNPAWTPDGRIVFTAARKKQDIAEDLGPDTVLIIIEGGGLGIGGRDGNTSPVVLQRTTSAGKIEHIPLSKSDAERMLRQQGIQSINLDKFYKP